jgi:hypothetical protein
MRDRYCNWQFFEFIKDKYCYRAINEMWTSTAPSGQRDPWNKQRRRAELGGRRQPSGRGLRPQL